MHGSHDCEYKCNETSIKRLYHINDPDLFKWLLTGKVRMEMAPSLKKSAQLCMSKLAGFHRRTHDGKKCYRLVTVTGQKGV